MGPLASRAVRAGLVLVCSVPVVARAMHERREQQRRLDKIRALAQQAASVAPHPGRGQRLVLDGLPVFFRTNTYAGGVAQALAAAAEECATGDGQTALGLPTDGRDDGALARPRPELTNVVRQDGDGAASMLCIFRDHEGTRVRYTLARRVDAGETSVFTVSMLRDAPLESTFLAEGDVPGGDFDDVPRPPGSKRLFVASLEGARYAVRTYEARGKVADVVAAFDRAMASAGWTPTTATADGRLYARGAQEVVASFEDRGEESIVTIAPVAEVTQL